jgi:hypothetical protein
VVSLKSLSKPKIATSEADFREIFCCSSNATVLLYGCILLSSSIYAPLPSLLDGFFFSQTVANLYLRKTVLSYKQDGYSLSKQKAMKPLFAVLSLMANVWKTLKAVRVTGASFGLMLNEASFF